MGWGKKAKAPSVPQQPRSADLTGFLDEGSVIEGTYAFSGTVMLNGRFTGEIRTGDTLIVGEKGVVHATVRAGTVIVSGEIVGNVVAGDRVELRGTARMFGDVEAPVVVVEEGVVFEGRCRMTRTGVPAVTGGLPPAATAAEPEAAVEVGA